MNKKRKSSVSLSLFIFLLFVIFFFQAEDGIRDIGVTGVQTCALPICTRLLSFRFWIRIKLSFRYKIFFLWIENEFRSERKTAWQIVKAHGFQLLREKKISNLNWIGRFLSSECNKNFILQRNLFRYETHSGTMKTIPKPTWFLFACVRD